MSAFIDEEVFTLESEEQANGISELIPIHVDSEEIPEPDVTETSQIVVFLDDCSLTEVGEPKTTASRDHQNVNHLIDGHLEIVDFYLAQHLLSDARGILNKLATIAPDDPLVNAKLEEFRHLENPDHAITGDPKTQPIPLSTVTISSRIRPGIGPLELEKIIGDLFDAENVSKRGKSESIHPRDYELPAAISKTGAIDEVIKQLMESMRSSEYEVLCYMIVGRNYLKREREISAIQCFKRGLHIRNLTEHDKIAFYFELGQTYQCINDAREAVYYYKKVDRHNPQYRDVAQRLELLRGRL